MTDLDDEMLAGLIRRAHRDAHLAVPLARITGARPRPRLLAPVLAAVAVAVTGVLLGTGWLLVGGVRPPQPVAPPPVTAQGKPPRPTSSATTAEGRCADYARPELAAAGVDALPPLRFDRELIAGGLRLRVYADDDRSVSCWLGVQSQVVEVDASNLTTTMDPAFPPGVLSNASVNWGHDPSAAYAFGRVPDGTSRVEVHFPGGEVRQAELSGQWYLLTATDREVDGMSEITKIVAVTPSGREELAIQHG